MRCASCGHLAVVHRHYRRGGECSDCPCIRFIHPVHGWLRYLWDRLAAVRRG